MKEKEEKTISAVKKNGEKSWEHIMDEEWKQMFNEIHKTTNSLFWRDFFLGK